MAKLTRVERKAAKRKNNLLEVKDSCVNCGQHIALDQRFCSFCGGKRIYNRLTWLNLIEDFADRFLNLENSFLKTFIAMFREPEDVIGGYMNGMRKKYLPAFSYFAIAITIAGVFAFLLKNYFMDDFVEAQIAAQQIYGVSPDQAEFQKEFSESWSRDYLGWLSEHQSMIYFALIPFLAIISRIVFWNYKNYNFVEHLVIYLYAYSHIAMITTTIGMLFIWNASLYQIVGLVSLPLMILYIGWVLKRLFKLDAGSIILKTALFGSVVIGISIVGLFILVASQVNALKNGEEFDNPLGKAMKMGFDSARERGENAKRVQDSIVQDSLNQLESTLELTPEMIRDTSQKE